MMQHLSIPDLESRKQVLEQLRESNYRLELAALSVDELFALVESDLRRQRRECLAKKQDKFTRLQSTPFMPNNKRQ